VDDKKIEEIVRSIPASDRDSLKRREFVDAKRHLYSLLLGMKPEEYSGQETNILFYLAQDDDIQKILKNQKP